MLATLIACTAPPRTIVTPTAREADRLTQATVPSAEVPIPSGLDRAHPLVRWLSHAGVNVYSVQDSVEGSLFQSANQAAWIKTDRGIADAVFFSDPAGTEDIQIMPLQSQETGRYLYRLWAPPPIMLEATRTIDAAYPLYFTVRHGMFIETSSEELDEVLQRFPAAVPP